MYSSHTGRRGLLKLILSAGMACALFAHGLSAAAQTRITYKSAKAGSSYYQMAVEIAQAMKAGSEGKIIVTVEESQGSVQNVMEAPNRPGNYVFTTPPSLIALAQDGGAMFKGKENPKFAEIRALFPIPSLTMHFVTRADAGIKSFADLAGKTMLIGKGSFGAKEAEKYFKLFGLEGKVKLANVELNNAVPALKNGQIDGFATAGSYPAPNVIEAAAGTSVHILSLTDEQISQTKQTRFVIPAGTYAGQNEDVVTTSLPVIAYTTTQMDDETAYQLTRTYWTQRAKMAASAPWWGGVNEKMLASIARKMHPGALRYYKEVGYPVTDANR
ncbi:MAG: TAXI family TRAP transporter solute-binding subunit [Burkholderiales bacterium]|nr:TAXI family TRAP transporter solute-binding subunit [Burkholderiales bacterium]